jgi:Uncharacterized protein conserved in bacteria (DUF2252)
MIRGKRRSRSRLPGIRAATRQYEAWLGTHVRLFTRDLCLKHRLMKQGPLPFLEATFYRWLQKLPSLRRELMSGPLVLAVGDLHIEAFRTWRDADDRLVWGVHDFDEALNLPYTLDLLRLATSALLACGEGRLKIRPRAACAAILDGYAASLRAGGRPIILAERHSRLRGLLYDKPWDDPQTFWKKARELPAPERPIPSDARSAIELSLPEAHLGYQTVTRPGGIGGLGRPRYVALADWHGARIGREAERLASSAVLWAAGHSPNGDVMYEATVNGAVRSPDPFLRISGYWIARRYGPQSGRLKVRQLGEAADAHRLLRAMGWETANIHLGTKSAVAAVKRDLHRRRSDWLLDSAKRVARDVESDWRDWSR